MKNKKLGYALFAVCFVLFNLIAFLIPKEKTPTFWIAYAFTIIAFLLQILIWRAVFGKSKTMKSKFLGFPIIYIGLVYFVIQIIAFVVLIAVPGCAPWIAAIVCAIILCLSLVCLISADAGKQEIQRIETKVKEKTQFIRLLQSDIEMLANTEEDPNIKQQLIQLAERVRLSDPMSDGQLSEIEALISEQVSLLKASPEKQQLIDTLNNLLSERNKRCMILKD